MHVVSMDKVNNLPPAVKICYINVELTNASSQIKTLLHPCVRRNNFFQVSCFSGGLIYSQSNKVMLHFRRNFNLSTSHLKTFDYSIGEGH